METRLERNKRLKKNKRLKRFKGFCFIILLILSLFSLKVVNQSLVELNGIEHNSIINFDMATKELNFFGKTYIIDLTLLRNN